MITSWTTNLPIFNVPHRELDAANKMYRLDIFVAVTVKCCVMRNIKFLVLEETGDAFLFCAFVMHLLEEGFDSLVKVFCLGIPCLHVDGSCSLWMYKKEWTTIAVIVLLLALELR